MSKDQFTEFLKKLDGDASLRAELHERFGRPEGGVAAGDLIAFAGEHGYEFSVEDAEGELSDAALEGVTGGAFQYQKIGGIGAFKFEEIKVTYEPEEVVFNFEKIEF